jgi:hypothetical protein
MNKHGRSSLAVCVFIDPASGWVSFLAATGGSGDEVLALSCRACQFKQQ